MAGEFLAVGVDGRLIIKPVKANEAALLRFQVHLKVGSIPPINIVDPGARFIIPAKERIRDQTELQQVGADIARNRSRIPLPNIALIIDRFGLKGSAWDLAECPFKGTG
jgi:hypothetical protein